MSTIEIVLLSLAALIIGVCLGEGIYGPPEPDKVLLQCLHDGHEPMECVQVYKVMGGK